MINDVLRNIFFWSFCITDYIFLTFPLLVSVIQKDWIFFIS